MLNKLLHSLFPYHCLLCDDRTYCQNLCSACKAELPWLNNFCQRCARPLPVQHVLCGQCEQLSLWFDNIVACCYYQNPISKFITEFKFNQKLIYGDILSQLLLEKIIATQQPLPQAIIPVPLHHHRLRYRGYNQAVELAKPVAKQLNMPLLTCYCQRIKATPAQSQLPANKRQQNIKNAFFVKKKIAYPHIALIDDVITTGNTINELSRILKLAGITQIDVWCIAKTG